MSTQESFIRGDSAPRCKVLPFYMPFLTGKVTLSYTFHTKWYSFHIPTVETLSFCGGSVRDILKGPFKFLNDIFSYPFYTSGREIPTLLQRTANENLLVYAGSVQDLIS